MTRSTTLRAAMIGALILLAGCSTGGPAAGDELACRHFWAVQRDRGAGVLTAAEVRGKWQEVYDDAKLGTLGPEAAALVRAWTSGGDHSAAESAMADGCRELGLTASGG